MAKILAVDDDEAILDALTLILEDSGYEVKTTLKEEEIYKSITHSKPDLILLDVLMSGVDGRVICKKLKQNPATTLIPLIMISAHPSAKTSAIKSGANEFLAKPFETTELLSLVKKYTA